MKENSKLELIAKKNSMPLQLRTRSQEVQEQRRQQLKSARHAAEDKLIAASYG